MPMQSKPIMLSVYEEKKSIRPSHHEISFATFSDVFRMMVAAGQLSPMRFSTGRDKHVPDLEVLGLYMTLIFEEFYETKAAYEEFLIAPDAERLAELIDGLFDLIWVCQGAMLAIGTPPKLTWTVGSWSNLSKIDSLTGEVIRNEDGKVQKPKGWKKPDFVDLVLNTLYKTEFTSEDVAKAEELWRKHTSQ